MLNHNGNGNGFPKQEPVWLALGMVTWAIAAALAPAVRTRFFEALERVVEDHEKVRQIVSFDRRALGKRELAKSSRIAATWVRRLLAEFRGVHGRGT